MSTPAYMPAYKFPKRAYGLYLGATVLIAVCMETIIYLTLLGNTLGPFSFTHQEKPLDPSLARQTRVAILVSRSSRRFYAENPEGVTSIEGRWQSVLGRETIPARKVSDTELGEGLGDANVVILPGAPCLDEAQRKTIVRFLAEGNGVIASGAVDLATVTAPGKGGIS